MNQDSIHSFKEKLDKHYAWPSLYTFKFIVPQDKEDQVRSLFPTHHISDKVSANGNYKSFTIQIMCPSSDFVIDVYQQASRIDGLIAL